MIFLAILDPVALDSVAARSVTNAKQKKMPRERAYRLEIAKELHLLDPFVLSTHLTHMKSRGDGGDIEHFPHVPEVSGVSYLGSPRRHLPHAIPHNRQLATWLVHTQKPVVSTRGLASCVLRMASTDLDSTTRERTQRPR